MSRIEVALNNVKTKVMKRIHSEENPNGFLIGKMENYSAALNFRLQKDMLLSSLFESEKYWEEEAKKREERSLTDSDIHKFIAEQNKLLDSFLG